MGTGLELARASEGELTGRDQEAARVNEDALFEVTTLANVGVIHWHANNHSTVLGYFEGAVAIADAIGYHMQSS